MGNTCGEVLLEGLFGCGLVHGQENEDGVFLNDQVASGPCTPFARDATGRVGDGSKSTLTRLIAHAMPC